MVKRILAIAVIFGCTTAAWAILGVTTAIRSENKETDLGQEVGQLWGSEQRQVAPQAYTLQGSRSIIPLESSAIEVDLQLEHRRKGLLWYATYTADFTGWYVVKNHSDSARYIYFDYGFPVADGVYDAFRFTVNGDSIKEISPFEGRLYYAVEFAPGEEKTMGIAYRTQGMDEWWYAFGTGVSQVRNFELTMTTDFDRINFPENAISPTSKEQAGTGWKLTWAYDNLLSGVQIGMEVPHRLNPGPFVSKVTFFAPVSLFFFFFITFMITTLRRIDLHPMNYFFLAAAFFSFHLLFAYLVDHVNLHAAFALSAVTSVFLVVSYVRLVVGLRFALVETGIAQVIYLVLFSYAFFLEGFTGLAITVFSILTLFVVMQTTGRVNWQEQWERFGKVKEAPPSGPGRL